MPGQPAEPSTQHAESLAYDHVGVLAGVRRTLPIAVSTFTIGLVFGVLARQAGLSVFEVMAMSVLVFSGAAQFVALGLWTTPLPVATILVTTLVVNLRHVLMGAALRPWFSRLPPLRAYATLFFMVDESWALTMSEYAQGRENGGFLLGSGIALGTAWISGSVVGGTAGTAISDPASLGLDFAFTAVFLALLVGLWKGRSDVLPWIVAALVSAGAAHILAGKWYILLGGLAGSLAGALRHAD